MAQKNVNVLRMIRNFDNDSFEQVQVLTAELAKMKAIFNAAKAKPTTPLSTLSSMSTAIYLVQLRMEELTKQGLNELPVAC